MNRRSRFLNGLFLVLIIFAISCHDKGSEQQISLKTLPPFVIKKSGAEIFQYWELKNDAYLWDTNFVQAPALKLYEDSVSKRLGKDTLQFILKKLSVQDVS